LENSRSYEVAPVGRTITSSPVQRHEISNDRNESDAPAQRHAGATRLVPASAAASVLCASGVSLFGIGSFYDELYGRVLLATESFGAAVGVCLLAMVLAGVILVGGYSLCLRCALSKPWNAARRISLILAALWTTIGAWLLVVEGIWFEKGGWNTGLISMIAPLIGLWVITFVPAPAASAPHRCS
jgi:hypothetical protein